ncbi:unnamed protein product [Macrosiphum euphorbiae]|uniref:Uncharacterized protein n=1 Tax=Macrosiphum euphorbiae TaxID=13131 RepID=A0AAV0X6G2_9HEMI|nr:unnamed protein product [Macrosiphum euphorbiae]
MDRPSSSVHQGDPNVVYGVAFSHANGDESTYVRLDRQPTEHNLRLSLNLAFSSARSTCSVWHIFLNDYQTISTTRHCNRSANRGKYFGTSHRTSNSACDGPK